MGSHFVASRWSPLEPLLRGGAEEKDGQEEKGRSLFLRGWLTEVSEEGNIPSEIINRPGVAGAVLKTTFVREEVKKKPLNL